MSVVFGGETPNTTPTFSQVDDGGAQGGGAYGCDGFGFDASDDVGQHVLAFPKNLIVRP